MRVNNAPNAAYGGVGAEKESRPHVIPRFGRAPWGEWKNVLEWHHTRLAGAMERRERSDNALLSMWRNPIN